MMTDIEELLKPLVPTRIGCFLLQEPQPIDVGLPGNRVDLRPTPLNQLSS